MEITIKTLDQARETHVTIEVNGDPLYTSCQVAHYQSTEAELVSKPLRRRIAELEGLDTELANARAEGQLRVEELEAQLSEFKAKAHAFNLDRKSEAERANRLNQRNTELEAELVRRTQERDDREAARASLEKDRDQFKMQAYVAHNRADENRAWAERAENRVVAQNVELAEAQKTIQFLSGQIRRINGAIHSSSLQRALWITWDRVEARAMKEAILQVRDALGSPSLPSSPAEPTSQA